MECVLHNCLSCQDKVADELTGGPVPLRSRRRWFETGSDTPDNSPLGNGEGDTHFSPTWAILRKDL